MSPITGAVDSTGRALVMIQLKRAAQSPALQAEGWIDTGCTAELVLPQATIVALGLAQSGTVNAQLADGSTVLTTYTCLLDWFGNDIHIEAVANNGQFPLIGVGLLRGHRLTIDYQTQDLTLQ